MATSRALERTLVGVGLCLAAGTRPATAQLRADPGTVINGQVAVRVYVTLSNDETAYVPIANVSLRFFRTTADTTVVVHTDAAGAATAMLSPGEYRLITTSPVDWNGVRYSWSRLVQVRGGMSAIDLNASSAERSSTIATRDSSLDRGANTVPPKRRDDFDDFLARKDPAMATMLSFFVTGTGQMYAGEPVKGAGLLALTAIGIGVAAKQLSCATDGDCESSASSRTLGAAGMVAFFGSWLYGIFDAGDAARRFNAAHGFATAIEPVVAPAPGGRTRLGLAVSFGR